MDGRILEQHGPTRQDGNVGIPRAMWLLKTWNVVTRTEEPEFSLYSNNLHSNRHMWLVSIIQYSLLYGMASPVKEMSPLGRYKACQSNACIQNMICKSQRICCRGFLINPVPKEQEPFSKLTWGPSHFPKSKKPERCVDLKPQLAKKQN